MGQEIGLVAIVESVGEVEDIETRNGTKKKFLMLVQYDQDTGYPKSLEVEYFGTRLPACYDSLAKGKQIKLSLTPTSNYSERHDRWFTRVSFWRCMIVGEHSADGAPEPTPDDF